MAQDPFVGEINLFPYTYAPRGWASCDGQLIPISQNTALFSLLGTTYGGDGRSTFALPNLNGRVAMHPGQGPGLPQHDLGEEGGVETVTLLASQMPSHSHERRAASGNATTHNPAAAVPATSEVQLYGPAKSADQALYSAGGGQPHSNMQPYLVLNYFIALQGVFPPWP